MIASKSKKHNLSLKWTNQKADKEGSEEILMSENKDSESIEVEGITIDDFSSNVPGVSSMISSPEPKNQLGIRSHHQFIDENGTTLHHSGKSGDEGKLQGWETEFFRGMKIDFRILSISTSFQEFKGSQAQFQREAFGINPDEFVSCVRDPANPKVLHVLITATSLLSKKEAVFQYLSKNSGNESTGDIKIELAS